MLAVAGASAYATSSESARPHEGLLTTRRGGEDSGMASTVASASCNRAVRGGSQGERCGDESDARRRRRFREKQLDNSMPLHFFSWIGDGTMGELLCYG